jgi:hypothetical protein
MITLIHFENGKQDFNEIEFIGFVQKLYVENEEPDTPLTKPQTIGGCKKYVREYCSNFQLLTKNLTQWEK